MPKLIHAAVVQLNRDRTAFQRIFVQDVRKCDDMLRILRYIKDLMMTEKIESVEARGTPVPNLQELHERLQDLEKEMRQHTASYTQLLKNRSELEENRIVLKSASQWFQQSRCTHARTRSLLTFPLPQQVVGEFSCEQR